MSIDNDPSRKISTPDEVAFTPQVPHGGEPVTQIDTEIHFGPVREAILSTAIPANASEVFPVTSPEAVAHTSLKDMLAQPERKPRRRLTNGQKIGAFAAGGALVLAGAGTGVGITIAHNVEAAQLHDKNTLKIPAEVYTPLIDKSQCSPNANDLQPNVVECNEFWDLPVKYQQVVLQAEHATQKEYDELPLENQQVFENFVFKNNAPGAIFRSNQDLNIRGLADYSLQDYDSNFSMSKDDGMKSASQLSIRLAVIDNLRTSDGTYDRLTAEKIASGVAVKGSPAHKELLRGIATADGSLFNGYGVNGNQPLVIDAIFDSTDEATVTIDGQEYQERTSTVSQEVPPLSPGTESKGLGIASGTHVKIRWATATTKTIEGETSSVLLVNAAP